jgi:hypothetical protein
MCCTSASSLHYTQTMPAFTQTMPALTAAAAAAAAAQEADRVECVAVLECYSSFGAVVARQQRPA